MFQEFTDNREYPKRNKEGKQCHRYIIMQFLWFFLFDDQEHIKHGWENKRYCI